MANVGLEIERLLSFGEKQGLIGKLDVIIARNELLSLFKLQEPYEGEVPEENPDYATGILDSLVEYAGEIGLFDREIEANRELFETRVMGILMPRASEIVRNFYELAQNASMDKATDYFYSLSLASNYIRTAYINKNVSWSTKTDYGDLEVTINLSKPEKDPKAIALEKLQPQSSYPKCLLCLGNIGYAGRINFPARQTLRIIPVTLCGEQWYLQYSPYVYYREHCIVFSENHEPMAISRKTFGWLLDFVRQFPHYICGSNADLPIVGGSILSHNHFQGGKHTFPMHKATVQGRYSHGEYRGISIEILKWPMSVIRAAGDSMEELIDFCHFIYSKWIEYSDIEVDICAFSVNEGQKTPHNTITPIARINPQGTYEMDMVLRNNRTSKEHPDGIFHPHKEIHHIKKENIGLIEVMGLAILPGRLKSEIGEIIKVMSGQKDIKSMEDEAQELQKHIPWIQELQKKYGSLLSEEEAEGIVRQEVGKRFMTCIEHAGVFKQDVKGREALGRFLFSAGCSER